MNYVALEALAARMLTDSGQTVTFTRNSGGTFDPVLGAVSGGTTTTITGKGMPLSYNSLEIDKTVVQTGDVKLLLQATSTAPAINDECTVGGLVYRVMNVNTLNLDNVTTIIYKVQLRK